MIKLFDINVLSVKLFYKQSFLIPKPYTKLRLSHYNYIIRYYYFDNLNNGVKLRYKH